MGKCGSKPKPNSSKYTEVYDVKQQMARATKLSQEADELLKCGNLDQAFHLFRASSFIMIEVAKKYPSYEEQATKYGSYCCDMMHEINLIKANAKSTEEKTGSKLSQFVGQDEVSKKILKMLQRSKTAQTHGYRTQDPSIFLYGAPGCGKTP